MDFKTLNLLFRCNKEFSHGKIRVQELSDTECMLCSYVYSHANCSQEDAAVDLKMDKTTVGKALTSLENKGCIERVQDQDDKRVKRLNITPKGYEKISNLMDIHNEWLSEILNCLKPEEQVQFENYCERLLAAAEELSEKNISGGKNAKQRKNTGN